MQITAVREVAGPWSLATCRAFWEGFTPAALTDQGDDLRTTFLVDADWTRAEVTVRQDGATARLTLTGDGDLEAAAGQTARFLALDVDATGWPAVGERDPVVGAVQRRFPGLRPCGFHSPYEAAVWAVLSQRIRITQAAHLRTGLIEAHGDRGALPDPARLRVLDLDLPGRKAEYLRAVAEAALDGVLDGARLRELGAEAAVEQVRQVKGLGPFAAELVVVRGANHPDAVPHHEARLRAVVAELYGPGTTLEQLEPQWRPFRTWAAFHLRASAG
ncbi:DNA-3-methyladenine glycosylase family protein [Actinoplanes sp. CA-030573]|uniref:DNA-3-methyladenine glycosylase family protein n=1 Tax=Actinoplanes sp. CA-030573 TaxID=3239898 RepID=UPI003D8F6EC2